MFLSTRKTSTPILHHSITPAKLLRHSQLSLTTPRERGFRKLLKPVIKMIAALAKMERGFSPTLRKVLIILTLAALCAGVVSYKFYLLNLTS